MDNQVVKYEITDAAIQEMNKMYMPLVIDDLNDSEQLKAVHDARMIVKNKRIAVDKKRKELKADALAWSKKVQSEANRIFKLLEPIESHLLAEEKKVQDEKDRLEQLRIDGIKSKLNKLKHLRIDYNQNDQEKIKSFIDYLEGIKIEPDIYFEFTQEASELLGEAIDLAQIELKKRIDSDEYEIKRKEEQDRLEKERIGVEKLKAIVAEIEKKQAEEQAKIDEEKRRIQAEKDAIEAAKKAERERKDREEFEAKAKAEAELKAKKEIELEKERLRLQEIEIQHAHEEALAEERRLEFLRPDRDKLSGLAQFLVNGIEYPVVHTKEATAIVLRVQGKLMAISDLINAAIEEM